ncbi:putative cell agglutination protein pfl4 [Paramyrothecium foliicola]|nr:putative cell agglutination protein pfl4 [Paramyrothecium foliicola]
MRYTTTLACLAGIAFADICQNNCGRAVAGTARANPDLGARLSLCSSFIAAATTITPTVSTVTKRTTSNAYSKTTEDSSPTKISSIVTGDKPEYASACVDISEYWSACQCFSEIVGPSIAVTTVSATTTVTTQSATTNILEASCTQGVEYAIYALDADSARFRNLVEALDNGHDQVDFGLQFGGIEPNVTGVTGSLGAIVQWEDDWLAAVNIYGNTGPANSEMSRSIIDHRGYFLPTVAGLYTIWLETADNALYAWIGDRAISGWSPTNPSISRFWPPDESDPYTYYFDVTKANTGKPIPFRFLWLNYGGPGAFSARVIDPLGSVILGPQSRKNSLVVTHCSGDENFPPSWASWAEEIYLD